jgi:long-chain acyl-CoA synthetase
VFKELKARSSTASRPVNTLFNALAHHPSFNTVDWSASSSPVAAAWQVQSATAKLWLEKTGCPSSRATACRRRRPSATCNPVDSTAYSGNIGMPLPNTELKLIDDDGNEVPLGTPGEIAIKGPQVMAGYWQRPDETAKVMTADGFFRSGDIGVVDERGYFKHRRPQEGHDPGERLQRVPERGRGRGHADARRARMRRGRRRGREGRRGGQAVHRQERPERHRGAGAAYCEANLTGYKRPKIVEFRTELPKTPVGKILRPRTARQGVTRLTPREKPRTMHAFAPIVQDVTW